MRVASNFENKLVGSMTCRCSFVSSSVGMVAMVVKKHSGKMKIQVGSMLITEGFHGEATTHPATDNCQMSSSSFGIR